VPTATPRTARVIANELELDTKGARHRRGLNAGLLCRCLLAGILGAILLVESMAHGSHRAPYPQLGGQRLAIGANNGNNTKQVKQGRTKTKRT
jgi:hypothetical protein